MEGVNYADAVRLSREQLRRLNDGLAGMSCRFREVRVRVVRSRDREAVRAFELFQSWMHEVGQVVHEINQGHDGPTEA
jgi:hypothetical protein